MKIVYQTDNKLYYLEKQPYEIDEDVFKRLWYIIDNNLSVNNIEDLNKSKKYLNEIKGMSY